MLLSTVVALLSARCVNKNQLLTRWLRSDGNSILFAKCQNCKTVGSSPENIFMNYLQRHIEIEICKPTKESANVYSESEHTYVMGFDICT